MQNDFSSLCAAPNNNDLKEYRAKAGWGFALSCKSTVLSVFVFLSFVYQRQLPVAQRISSVCLTASAYHCGGSVMMPVTATIPLMKTLQSVVCCFVFLSQIHSPAVQNRRRKINMMYDAVLFVLLFCLQQNSFETFSSSASFDAFSISPPPPPPPPQHLLLLFLLFVVIQAVIVVSDCMEVAGLTLCAHYMCHVMK